MRIDDKDKLILGALRRNARMTNKSLAEFAGLSASACFDRVRKLERSGIICGYHARLSEKFASMWFEAWASVALLDLPHSTQEEFLALVGRSSNVSALYQLSGAFDCVLRFSAVDAAAWRSFCSQLAGIGIETDRVRFGLIVSTYETGDGKYFIAAAS